LSCAPDSSGAEPDEASVDVGAHGESRPDGVPAGTDFAESRRWVSEDGEVVSFLTAQNLVPGDIDGANDGYLWHKGALSRLPGIPFGGSEALTRIVGPFLSHDGSTVAFVTATSLLPIDGDTTADVYVARDQGGYPSPVPDNPCIPGHPDPTTACQQTRTAPLAPHAASEAAGPGNVRPNPCARPARRAQQLSKRAKRLHRNARRVARANRGRAVGMRRKANRLARQGKGLGKQAERCRARRSNRGGRQ
jgi:hypothetical protein